MMLEIIMQRLDGLEKWVAQDNEHILRQQEKDKQDILQRQAQDKQDILHRFDSFVPRLDSLEKQAAQDKEETQKQHTATQKLLQRQGKQCEIMQATFQQSLTAQNAHILQIQSDGDSTTQQVKLLGKQHEQMRTEAKNTKENMETLEAGIKEMCHGQSKLKDNERAWMEIHGQQMLALTEEVAQQNKATNAQ